MVSLDCYPCFCEEKNVLELFTSQAEEKFIRCKARKCGFFTKAEGFSDYMTAFMDGVLDQYRNDQPRCNHRQAATFCVSKSEKNPGRGYFRCGQRGEKCRYFQWSDEKPSKLTIVNSSDVEDKEVQTEKETSAEVVVEVVDDSKKRKADVKKTEKKEKKRKVNPLNIE